MKKVWDTTLIYLITEDTRYEPTKFLEKYQLTPKNEETKYSPKYEPTNPKDSVEISHRKVEFVSSDSEDDSGIQVLNEFSKNNTKTKKSSANLIDLAIVSSECESDVEHLPYFRKLKSVSYIQWWSYQTERTFNQCRENV